MNENVKSDDKKLTDEQIKKLIELASNIKLDELKPRLLKKAKQKFVVPLRTSTKLNLKYLNSNMNGISKETFNLIKQAQDTIKNCHKLLTTNSVTDANILLRASFENLVMGMMIYFDQNVYDEFKNLNIDDTNRNYTKQQTLRNAFRKKLKTIDSELFGLSNTLTKKLLDDFYNKLCLYTHSTLIVNEMVEISKNGDQEVFVVLTKQNVYLVEIMINSCLRYLNNNHFKSRINELYLLIGLFVLVMDLDKNKLSKEYLEKYNEFLYLDINREYIKKNEKDVNNVKELLDEINKEILNNPPAMLMLLEEFTKC